MQTNGQRFNKIKQTITVAIFVSLASQVRFNLITDGFIVALSVMVMAIFIYCYEDLSARYIAFCSAIFSPLFRLIITLIQNGEFEHTVLLVVPDVAFFLTYGVVYTLIYKYIVRGPKSIKNFPYVIFFCDLLSNVGELTARSFIHGSSIFTINIITYLCIIAACRTLLIQVVIIAIEAYSSFLVKKEHDEEYLRLLTQASIFESELHIMEKNAFEIEDIMKNAYNLYKSMEEINAPKELKDASLDISKNAHEIKGDYMNIINVLHNTYVSELSEGTMSIMDIVSIEKANVSALIKKRGYDIDVVTKFRANFYVRQNFKMMSIIRNLLTNAAEAIGNAGGRITLSVEISDDKEQYIITVNDNGKGMDDEELNSMFLAGFSTKFDPATGDIQRGMGLSLVKDYVENFFSGQIKADSEKGRYTEFTITMPTEVFRGNGEKANEVLHS